MNRTNTGANTNTVQILLDIFVVVLVFGVELLCYGDAIGFEDIKGFSILVLIFILIYILSNRVAYLYNITLFFYLDRIHRKLTMSFLTAAIATGLLLEYISDSPIKEEFFLIFLVCVYALSCLKMFAHSWLLNLTQKSVAQRTAFVGTKEEYNKFHYFMNKTSVVVIDIGYIAKSKKEYQEAEEDEYIGCVDNLEEVIRKYNLDQIYIMQNNQNECVFTQQYVDLCIAMGVTVRLIIDFYKRRGAYSYVSTIGTYPVIAYHTVTLNTYEQILKRIVDICGALVGILLTWPIMLVTAICIKLDSPGPVLFKQSRVGKNGRIFKIYKFRSMYIDAEERKKELMAQNEIEGNIMFKMKDDPRITKVGKIIRKLSIDELPQFFNILFGTMSLVGTRPPTLDEVEKYNTNQWRRISIKPGLTGMWQVSGRSKIKNFDEIVEMDVEYIDKWSLTLDFKIILKTVVVLLKHNDAY